MQINRIAQGLQSVKRKSESSTASENRFSFVGPSFPSLMRARTAAWPPGPRGCDFIFMKLPVGKLYWSTDKIFNYPVKYLYFTSSVTPKFEISAKNYYDCNISNEARSHFANYKQITSKHTSAVAGGRRSTCV